MAEADFTGRTAIVTGGASGIGEATVREFARLGANVAVVDRDAANGERVAASVAGGRVRFFAADVSSAAGAQQAIAESVRAFGGVDVLVSNAGIQRYGTVVTTSEEVWDEVMTVNLKAAFLMSKHAVPEMERRGGGAIVINGSIQSMLAIINSAAYVASKHALLGLTRAMALDHARQNIRVNCVCPGAIDTPMLRWSASLGGNADAALEACASVHALGRIGRPDEVARAIVFLAGDAASFITGQALMVDGGMSVPAGGMAFQRGGIAPR